MAVMRFHTTLQSTRPKCAMAAIAAGQVFAALLMERMISDLKPCSAIPTWHSFHPAKGQWAQIPVMLGSVTETRQELSRAMPTSRK
jgi:hypothetical protein